MVLFCEVVFGAEMVHRSSRLNGHDHMMISVVKLLSIYWRFVR